jgi:hypothetical protein
VLSSFVSSAEIPLFISDNVSRELFQIPQMTLSLNQALFDKNIKTLSALAEADAAVIALHLQLRVGFEIQVSV